MAEAYFNHFDRGVGVAWSAGFQAATEINPYVLKVMAEDGFDLSNNTVDHVFDYYKEGKFYGYIVTVCEHHMLKNVRISQVFQRK
jgi:arsenate reductase